MICCVGTTPTLQRTLVFDKLQLDEVNRSQTVDEYAAGKAPTAARVVHTLGEPVLCIGPAGGHRGGPLLADLAASGIAHDFVISASPTRLCCTLLDRSTSTATEIVEEASPLSEHAVEELLTKLRSHARRIQVLVLSGSLAPGVSHNFYASCMEACPNAAVVVDAVGPALLETLKLKPRVIKPNQSEIAKTLGIEISTEAALKDAMRHLITRGAEWVVCTRGKDGVLVTDGQSFFSIASPRVEAINPIGSGDSVAAGIAVGLRRGLNVPEAAKLGVACGAANATTHRSAEVHREDVERLLAEVMATS